MSEDTNHTSAPDSQSAETAQSAIEHILGNAHRFSQTARDFKQAAHDLTRQDLSAALGYETEADSHSRYVLKRNGEQIRVTDGHGNTSSDYSDVMKAQHERVNKDVAAITHIIANAPTAAKTAHMDLRNFSSTEQQQLTQLPKALDAARSVLDSLSQIPVTGNADRKQVAQAIQNVAFIDATSGAISGMVNSTLEHNTGMSQRAAQFASDAQEDAARNYKASSLKEMLRSSRDGALEGNRGYNRYRDTAKRASQERSKTIDTKATLQELAADPAASKDDSARVR